MVNKVIRTAERFDMLPRGGCVIAALSGGADSVAMLHCLISVKEKFNIKVAAAHLNHQLRGEEADRDEAFCKILCEKYNIPFYVRHRDISRLARERKISEELCGREERYSFFEELAQSLDARVATAHTASDNAETLIFNLTRGASLTGAGGIPARRGRYIRPLIACTRTEIEAYCRSNGLDFMTDSTNLSDDYTRNKIRHNVIPALRELNPRFEEALLRFCDSVNIADEYIERKALDLTRRASTENGFSAKSLLEADPAVLNRSLALLCRSDADFQVEARHLELLKGILKNGGAVDLGQHIAVCKQGLLRISKKTPAQPLCEVPLSGAVSFEYGGLSITAVINNSDKEIKDYVFRGRRGGERFTFPARGVTKQLRKALNEKKIPAERRDTLVLLCSGSVVLWCEGLGFSLQGNELARTSGLKIKAEKIDKTIKRGEKDA